MGGRPQTRGGESLRWFWSLTVNGPMTRSDRVATLEEAKARFQKSWGAWKAWAKLEETTPKISARLRAPKYKEASHMMEARGLCLTYPELPHSII